MTRRTPFGVTIKARKASRAMDIARIVLAATAAAWVGFSAISVFQRRKWIVDSLKEYGVGESWWPWLATAKAAGAVGLVVGIFVPVIGLIAGICLVVYFLGAVSTVLHARVYGHVLYPIMYLVPVVAAGVTATLALGRGVLHV